MKYVMQNGDGPRWAEAMRAKFEGEGKPYGRAEWDDMLGDYGVGVH